MIICFVLLKWCGCVEISCFLENLVPHINVLIEFNKDTSESAREHRNRLQREQCARQHIELVGPSKTPQERSSRMCQEWRTVQQATSCAQPSFGNDALQLFGDKDASTPTRWDCGEMDIIYGFSNTKMWIKERLAKLNNKNP
jgi:hypothetical protein